MSGDRMVDEVERSWKEVVVAYLRQYPSIFLAGLREITASVMIAIGKLRFELNTIRM
jgi:hypothetical protein